MADDIKNRPNRPATPDDSGFESIKRIGEKYSSKGPLDAQERMRLEQASDQINGLNQFIEENPAMCESKAIQRNIKQSEEVIKALSPRVALRRETFRDRAVRETSASVQREFDTKTINGEVKRAAGTSAIGNRGMSMASRSQKELERERSSIMAQIGQLEEKTSEVAQNDLYDVEGRQNPEALDVIKASYRKKKALTNKAAGIEAALKRKRVEGTDDESQDRDLLTVGKEAKQELFRNKVKEEMQSGQGMGAMSPSQLNEKMVAESKVLVEALDKLKNSANESAETIEKFKEEAHDAAENLKKTKEAIAAGGGPIDPYRKGGQIAGLAAGLMNTVGAAAQESLINQPMQVLGRS